jgi:hypothetical protein
MINDKWKLRPTDKWLRLRRKKKEFTQSGIPTPQALHQNRPKGTASIYNL